MKARSLITSLVGSVAIAWLAAFPPLSAQQNPAAAGGVRAMHIRPNFYVLVGAGANIGVLTGEDGLVLVDAGLAMKASAVLGVLKTLSDKPIRYIIDTSPDPDHVGGNEQLAKAGASLFPNNAGNGFFLAAGAVSNSGAASIISTEKLYARMSAPTGIETAYPVVAWPTETFTRKQKVMFLNDEGIQVIAEPGAHTDGDSIVLFRRTDVIVAGDIFDTTRFPVIDVDRGGTVQGEIDALNRLIDMAIPSIPLPWKEGGTLVVPSHGRVSEQAELVEYRDMVVIVRDRIQDLLKNRMTLDQIKAAAPTAGWSRRYGAGSANLFVEAIYKSLTLKTTPAAARRQ